MSKAIILDLIALTCCRHPTERVTPDHIYTVLEAINEFCMDGGNVLCVSETQSRRYRDALRKLLERVEKGQMGYARDLPLVRMIYAVIGRAERAGRRICTKRDACKIRERIRSGPHRKEYVEIAELLCSMFPGCRAYCAIVCLDRTFSAAHLEELARCCGFEPNTIECLDGACGQGGARPCIIVKKGLS